MYQNQLKIAFMFSLTELGWLYSVTQILTSSL